jgi:muramoyltetrapeptide carboxypeptidase
MRRRDFLAGASLPLLGSLGGWRRAAARTERAPGGASPGPPSVRPKRLQPGDIVGVVTPATATFQQVELDIVRESLEGLGLVVRIGPHVLNRHGSLGGDDRDRAADINAFFADPAVKAVLPTRGGWGSSRLLPLLDYEAIRRNPKVVMGYSDITALLNGIHAQTGVVTFHGPNGGGRWDEYSLDFVRRVVFNGEAVTFGNPKTTDDKNVLTQIDDRTRTITPGRARGTLLGGNLTVLTAILGSPYVPAFDGSILFIEDVGEEYYRIDRMMTQLAIAGVLGRIRGFIFGTCSECTPGEGYASFTLEEILNDHIAPLGIPAWQGAMIGHGMPQWTLPVGGDVEIDAGAATVTMLAPAVE